MMTFQPLKTVVRVKSDCLLPQILLSLIIKLKKSVRVRTFRLNTHDILSICSRVNDTSIKTFFYIQKKSKNNLFSNLKIWIYFLE